MSKPPKKRSLLATTLPLTIIGGVVIIGLGAYFSYIKVMKRLSITHGVGGIVSSPGTGTFKYWPNTQVEIKATANEGWTIGRWTVNGSTLVQRDDHIYVTMDVDTNVDVSFWEGGVPPPTEPAYLTPPPTGFSVLQPYGATFVIDGSNLIDGAFGYLHAGESDTDGKLDFIYTPGDKFSIAVRPKILGYKMTWKVRDSNQILVPDVPVFFWTSGFPDTSQYLGLLLLNSEIHGEGNPLRVVSDSNGEASFYVSYIYQRNDNLLKLSQDTAFKFTSGTAPFRQQGYVQKLLKLRWWYDADSPGPEGTMNKGMAYPNLIAGQIVGKPAVQYQILCQLGVVWPTPSEINNPA